MDWAAFNAFGEKLEMWTTIVVNMTAIITGLVVATQWFVRRIEPTVKSVSGAAAVSLVTTVIGTLAGFFLPKLLILLAKWLGLT